MPIILDTITAHRAQLRAREDAAMREMAQRWLQIEHALRDGMDALALELASTETTTATQIWRSQRYIRLRQQIAEQVAAFRNYASETIQAEQAAAINMALQHSAAMITTIARDVGATVDFNRLPVEAVQAIVGQSGDGSPLAAILADASNAGEDALRRQLIAGLALGRNPADLAHDAIRRGLGLTFTRTSTIFRTEMLRAYRYTSLQAYRGSGVVTGYKRISARDSNCCLGCILSDGQEYDLASEFDEHPSGRCTIVPKLRDYPLNIGTGQEWFNRQNEATQRTMLGKARYQLWQDGKVELSDMVTRVESADWGGALVPTSVGVLEAGVSNGI